MPKGVYVRTPEQIERLKILCPQIRSKRKYTKGYHLTQEHKLAISNGNKGKIGYWTGKKRPEFSGVNHPLYGKHLTEEHKIKVSKSLLGREVSEETRRKIGLKHKGKKLSDNQIELLRKINVGNTYHLGYHQTRDIKEKLRKLYQGKTYEELYGIEKAKEMKRKIGVKMKGHPCYKNPERSKKIREKTIGVNHPMYGKKHTEEFKNKLREKRLKQIFPIKDTSIELSLQRELNDRNIIYEKHKPLIGQPDIFIFPNLCIFADGDYWHNRTKSIEIDRNVNNQLSQSGFLVLRYWEHEINNNVNGCVDEIEDVLCLTNSKASYRNI